MNAKPAIIFDLGGVLIDWNPRYLYRQMFPHDEAIQNFIDETNLLHWNEQQDAGRPFAEAVQLLSADFPQYENHIRAFHERWLEMVGGAIDGTVEILQTLKNNDYELYALTNWSAETYPLAYERYEFLRWFRHVAVSGELKIIKPDPRIFHHLLSIINRPANECIYIDDSHKNFLAAQNLGFRALHFQAPEQLQRDLSEQLKKAANHARETPPKITRYDSQP